MSENRDFNSKQKKRILFLFHGEIGDLLQAIVLQESHN